jgi:molecular chaperone DnaK
MAETLFQQPPHLKVNPDEVVALGAAIQAHALNRSRSAKQPKRPSAHDQLAKAQPSQSGERQASQPPNAHTVPTAADVPRAPPLPAGLKAPQPAPQFFDLSKPNPVLTFSPPPEAPHDAPPKDAGKQGRSPPPVPKAKPARPNLKPIEGTPARLSDSESSGPKPARHSAAPAARIGPPPLAPKTNVSGTYGSAAPPEPPPQLEEVPDLVLEPARSDPPDLGAIVSAEIDEQPASPPLELNQAAFARGSAIATSDNAPLLIDVTPLSLRVETVGGYSDVLIAANTSVPCEKSRTFLTARDGQTVVFIRVAQGEGTKFAENTFLGELELSGLTAARRGEVKILVTFELDADGILNVRAKDKDTGRETKAQMKVSGASADASDVQQMMQRQARHVVA